MAGLLIFFLFTGCSSMADRLSGSGHGTSIQFNYPAQLAHITLGVTTQQEVRKVFGTPTDLQTSILNGILRDTWAYAQATPSINPLQYLPLIGALALPPQHEDLSFSVSFSSAGIVDGISVRGFQPYGDVVSSPHRDKADLVVQPYGTNNPMIQASQYHLSSGQSPDPVR